MVNTKNRGSKNCNSMPDEIELSKRVTFTIKWGGSAVAAIIGLGGIYASHKQPIYDDITLEQSNFVKQIATQTEQNYLQENILKKNISISAGDLLYNRFLTVTSRYFTNEIQENSNKQEKQNILYRAFTSIFGKPFHHSLRIIHNDTGSEILFNKKILNDNDELLQHKFLHEYIHIMDFSGHIDNDNFLKLYGQLEEQKHPIINDINKDLAKYKGMDNIVSEKIAYFITYALINEIAIPQEMADLFSGILKEGVLKVSEPKKRTYQW